MDSLLVRQIPCLRDNYAYLVHDPASGETAAIDAPDAEAILAALEETGWRLTWVFNTHHHQDHAGGNLALKEATGCRILGNGADRARLPGLDVEVSGGDTVTLGTHTATVLDTPGHTRAHICFHFPADRLAFVGDTLFAMGCGRLFEGTPAQMLASLETLAALPDETRVYCAHEYTETNGRFALTVEPDNPELVARMEQVLALRAQGKPTVPTTIGLEKATNPFLRSASPGLRATLGMSSFVPDVEVFTETRRRKDRF
jgi:hydroxyacylglutathione hydrolase